MTIKSSQSNSSNELVKWLREKDGAIKKQKESINYLNNELHSAKFQIDELNQNSHHWWLEAERLNNELENERQHSEQLKQLLLEAEHWMTEVEKLEEELQTVYKSKSWLVTWPLRKVIQLAKWIVNIPKMFIRWLLLHVVAYIRNHPNLKERLKHYLKFLNISTSNAVAPVPESVEVDSSENKPDEQLDRTPSTLRAENINQKLKIAIKQFERENY